MAERENKEILPFEKTPESLLLGGSASAKIVPREETVTQQLVSPRLVHKHYDPHDLVSLAAQVQQADEFVQATTTGKLQVVVDQIRYLQEQAHKILLSAKRDAQLHHAACNFVKVPGKIYHLYEKKNGTSYFSMLSPEEWGGNPPNTFLGSYKLEFDRSWTPLAEINEREKDIGSIHKAIMSAMPSSDEPQS
ncbi:PREDICTED: uncharacterized protein C1orf50 homolog [Amphimedon queenslandica]|uniref:DUF2452 domain-containing protein n=1 Tax=Amphimedon queenslandica TaxID=400682 RepID=A0A1X7V906_AMPQE|nr:PREDICTED: uncharacterized protein C1orf50 homolog [Amphimedon queenslandica]|eukprot:XP_003385304.1 PREDICTED: uncharacterized protein C1orf50 homolog [Amphimedon queenslandica]